MAFTHNPGGRSHVAVTAGEGALYTAYRSIYTTPVDNRPNKALPTEAGTQSFPTR